MAFVLRLLTILVIATSLAACEDAAAFDARRAVPEDVQRAAFDECAKRKGFLAAWIHLHKLKSRDGLLYVAGSDGSGITVGEAFGLNKCAWAKLDAYIASN